jgi:hypothetical protein
LNGSYSPFLLSPSNNKMLESGTPNPSKVLRFHFICCSTLDRHGKNICPLSVCTNKSIQLIEVTEAPLDYSQHQTKNHKLRILTKQECERQPSVLVQVAYTTEQNDVQRNEQLRPYISTAPAPAEASAPAALLETSQQPVTR